MEEIFSSRHSVKSIGSGLGINQKRRSSCKTTFLRLAQMTPRQGRHRLRFKLLLLPVVEYHFE